MLRQLRTTLVVLLSMTLLTGVIYPCLVTVVAQSVFSRLANGSMIENEGQLVGSELIGQQFTRADYFWGRLSATAPHPYNASASGGSNFGPLNPRLLEAAEGRIAALRKDGPQETLIPVDLVTASASGLDPHLSPAAAEFQVQRVARSRKMSEDEVRQLVKQHTSARQFGALGEPRVDVLKLNLSLDQLSARKKALGD